MCVTKKIISPFLCQYFYFVKFKKTKIIRYAPKKLWPDTKSIEICNNKSKDLKLGSPSAQTLPAQTYSENGLKKIYIHKWDNED